MYLNLITGRFNEVKVKNKILFETIFIINIMYSKFSVFSGLCLY